MEITFSDNELADLYEGLKPKKKEWKSNPALIRQFVKTVDTLASAEKIEDLNTFGGLQYKKLTDDPKGMSAVRINKQFRLHFMEITNDADPPKVVLLEIREISNHYKTR